MGNDWFYIRDGQQTGPVPFEELTAMAGRGEIAAHDLVWCEGMADWQPAHSIDGLLPAGTAFPPGPGPGGPGGPPPGPGGRRPPAYQGRRRQPAKTGIPGLVIGNTAEQILSRVNCSVMALKPRGWQSPVTV